MAWQPFGKKNDESNAEAGGEGGAPEKTPAELIAEAVGAALKPVAERFEAGMTELRTKVEAVETQTKRPEHVEAAPVERASVFDNEEAAFAERLGPVLKMNFELEAKIARNEVKAELAAKGYAETWNTYEKEIDALLESAPLVVPDGKGGAIKQRGNKEYIYNVVKMVFGSHAMEANVRFGGKDKGFFVESAGGGDGVTTTGAHNDGLSDSQRTAFAKFGITAADGAKTIERMKKAGAKFEN